MQTISPGFPGYFIFAKTSTTVSNYSAAQIEWHYLPSIAYFAALLRYPKIIVEEAENYQKGTYRNRCHLAGANGWLRLSIPLAGGKHQQQPVAEVRIDNHHNWQTQHWRSIQSAYGKTPFFEHYADDFLPLYQQTATHLVDWNKRLLNALMEALDLEIQLESSTSYQPTLAPDIKDLRNVIHPKRDLPPCFSLRPYPQAFLEKHGFIPNLSILDLLFCMGPQSIEILEDAIK